MILYFNWYLVVVYLTYYIVGIIYLTWVLRQTQTSKLEYIWIGYFNKIYVTERWWVSSSSHFRKEKKMHGAKSELLKMRFTLHVVSRDIEQKIAVSGLRLNNFITWGNVRSNYSGFLNNKKYKILVPMFLKK